MDLGAQGSDKIFVDPAIAALADIRERLFFRFREMNGKHQTPVLTVNDVAVLGGDFLGRDILSRTLYGARLSLMVGVIVTLAATSAGIVVGLIAGTSPRADRVLMRVMDGLMAFPDILLAIALMASLGPSARQSDCLPVKASGRVKFQVRRYLERVIDTRRVNLRSMYLNILANDGVLWTLRWIFERWIYFYVTYQVLVGTRTIGEWGITFWLLGQFRGPMERLVRLVANFRLQMVPAQRMLETLDVPPDIVDLPAATHLPRLRGAVEFQDVSFEYVPGQPALKQVSFAIQPGQTVAFVGPSGAGPGAVADRPGGRRGRLHRAVAGPRRAPNLGGTAVPLESPSIRRGMSRIAGVAIIDTDLHPSTVRTWPEYPAHRWRRPAPGS